MTNTILQEHSLSTSQPSGFYRRRDTILFVSIAAGIGGSTRSLATILTHLDHGIYRVVAIPGAGNFQSMINERRLAEEHLSIPRPRSRPLRRLSRLYAAYRILLWTYRHRDRIIAIHANGLQEVNLVTPAVFFARVPLVAWIHDFEVYPWTMRLAPLWRQLLGRRSVRWAAVSSRARRIIVESTLAPADQVVIIPNPIDPLDIQGERTEPSGLLTIGFLGGADRRKGFHLLPAVEEKLSDIPLRWLVFTTKTPGGARPVWERLRDRPPGRMSFSGKVRDVRRAFAQCDIIFCPSLKESFCRVAAEAMLNGLPVVASDIEPLRDLLGDEEAGLLFPPGDSRAAADAIRRLALDGDLRRRLGQRGRERARAFEPANVIERLAEMYAFAGRREGQ